jgi:hypothetical protein
MNTFLEGIGFMLSWGLFVGRGFGNSLTELPRSMEVLGTGILYLLGVLSILQFGWLCMFDMIES